MDRVPPAGAETPEALLARWRGGGDAGALAALFDATAPDLFRIALSTAPDPATAEDALQETFLALMEAAPRIDLSRPLVPFLVGILRHKVEKGRARNRRVPDPARLPDPDLRVEDPVRAAVRSEEAERVRRAILALPEAYRQAALLRWTHGLEPAEIAEVLGKPPGTVWSLLSRARDRLRDSLASVPVVLAAGVRPPRGLEEVRAAVAARAETLAGAAADGGAALAVGGILVGKKTAVAVLALLLLIGGAAWFARPGEEGPTQTGGDLGATAPIPREGKPSTGFPVAERNVGAGEDPTGSATATGVKTAGSSPGEDEFGPLPPDYPGVSGRVVHADRRPAVGARVHLPLPDGRVVETRTDEDGNYLLLPPRFRSPGPLRTDIVAEDGKGGVARHRVSAGYPPELTGKPVAISGLGGVDLVLRPARSLAVKVVSGGIPVAGALVQAALEGDWRIFAPEVRSDGEGGAVLSPIPEGEWTVFACARGLGRGRARVSLREEGDGPVEIGLSSRTVDVEVVEQGDGRAMEGVRLLVRAETTEAPTPGAPYPDPPLEVPPSDSSGRTRIEGISATERLEVLPILPGDSLPRSGTVPVLLAEGATALRVEVRGTRTLRWPLAAGGRPVPPEGTEIALFEAAELRLASLGIASSVAGRVEGGELIAEGLGLRALNLLARAPDGSLARLRAAEGAARGAAAAFSDPCSLEVVVRDEDGAPVTDALVTVKDDEGEPLGDMVPPDAEGRTLVEGLPAGTVVICALSHWDYGGAEVARADLVEGTARREVVVGRAFTVGVRVRVGGKPALPAEMSLEIRYPGPGPLDGALCFERPGGLKEDAGRGEVRFRVRPHAPGKPVAVVLSVPGREPVRGEVRPPEKGIEEAWMEFDLR